MRISRTVVPLLVASALLGGCGDSQSADEKAMDHKFERIDFEISTLETVTSSYNTNHFVAATRRYIALVRQYADVLGPKEAKRRLSEEADTIGSYCLPCNGMLTEEASRY